MVNFLDNHNTPNNTFNLSPITQYKIGICELYHPFFHGCLDHLELTEKKALYGSYLCFAIFNDDELNDPDLFPHDGTGPWGLSTHRVWPEVSHPFIRNYSRIIQSYNVDIFTTYIKDGVTLCIPKTFWLKIFQRKCKKYYRQLQMRIQRAKNPRNLMKREIYGQQI